MRHSTAVDLKGRKFGRLIVLRRAGRIGSNAAWLCRCNCGQEVVVQSNRLVAGLRKSCAVNGHYWRPREPRSLSGKFPSEYISWKGMLKRCQNKKEKRYPNYGGRGIKVCERWNSFAAFFEDMGPKPTSKHTIERKDVNGHYEKDNCRWATREEQYRNKTNSVFVTYKGQKLLLIDLVLQLGLNRNVVYQRLKLGWSLETAIAIPVKRKK